MHRRPTSRWLVYLLCCRDGSLYCGITNDLAKRLKAHVAGKASRYTRSRLPVSLVHQEPQPTKSAALRREAAIKKLSRKAKLEVVAAGKARPPGREMRCGCRFAAIVYNTGIVPR